MPGVLKNALDWLVRSGELYAKPVAVLCAAPSSQRGTYVRQALQQTLEAQGATVIISRSVAMLRSTSSTLDHDPEILRVVIDVLEALNAAVDAVE